MGGKRSGEIFIYTYDDVVGFHFKVSFNQFNIEEQIRMHVIFKLLQTL